MPRGRPRVKRPKRAAHTYAEEHPCTRNCGTMLPAGAGAWCKPCRRAYTRDYMKAKRSGIAFGDDTFDARTARVVSKPPPPPPGFDQRDRFIGRPWSG